MAEGAGLADPAAPLDPDRGERLPAGSRGATHRAERRVNGGRRRTDHSVPETPVRPGVGMVVAHADAVRPDCDGCASAGTSVRRSFDLVRRAVWQTADSVVITDRRGVIEYVNPAFERTTGFSAAEAVGQTPRLLKSGKQDAAFYEAMWRELEAGRSFEGEIVNRTKSGRLYRAEQTITPMADDAGEITHFVSVLKDVTELREAQESTFYLGLAREVQQHLYRPGLAVPGLELAFSTTTLHLTGGDYFDVLPQDDGSALLVIADVSGHGIVAALVMAEVRAYVRAFARQETPLGDMLARVNNILAADLLPHQYVTLLAVRIDPRSGRLEYCSAGHVAGHVLRADPAADTLLGSTGRPLGLFPDHSFVSRIVPPLERGDVLVLVTDGFAEARDAGGVELGAGRLREIARDHRAAGPAAVVEALSAAVVTFTGAVSQEDDLTSVVCRLQTDHREA
jgi:phosphoserine phosphatase RsbU/P